MSSESKPQHAPAPSRRPRRAADPGARPWPASGDDPGAAGRARAGYDPATWPGDAPEVPGSAMAAEPSPDGAGPAGRAGEPEPDEARVLTDPKAMRALAHPLRMDLLELFGVYETLTATQASEVLGESPANCAFHLRTLAKYGFVKEAGGGRGRERPWTMVDRNLNITAHQDDPEAAVAADALGRVMLERWLERARRVFGSTARVPGWEHASGWSSGAAYLTAEETIELTAEMRKLVHRYERRRADPAKRPAGALPVEWAIFAAPITGVNVEGASAQPAAPGEGAAGSAGR